MIRVQGQVVYACRNGSQMSLRIPSFLLDRCGDDVGPRASVSLNSVGTRAHFIVDPAGIAKSIHLTLLDLDTDEYLAWNCDGMAMEVAA